MPKTQWKLQTTIGPLYLVATERGLAGVSFEKQKVPMAVSLSAKTPEVQLLKQTVQQLDEYFEGKRKAFDVPFDIDGTPFQRSVWNQLSKIPYGKTFSYRDVAQRIRNPKAVRAVGSANGRNPLAVIVPCHRVIAADGTLGGYGGGLQRKSLLLKLEQAAHA